MYGYRACCVLSAIVLPRSDVSPLCGLSGRVAAQQITSFAPGLNLVL